LDIYYKRGGIIIVPYNNVILYNVRETPLECR